MAAQKSSAGGRTRNFATVVYLDSAPENWFDILTELHVPAFVSPYHDKDTNPDGEPKKPHYHVLLCFDGVKSDSQVKEMCEQFGGVGMERVAALRGYARYLCHLDNPEKYQYSTDEVRSLGGADYFSVCSLQVDKYVSIGDMMDFCVNNGIYSYSELLMYCRENRFDWFRCLCDNGTMVMKEFLKSLYWTTKADVDSLYRSGE